MNITEVNSKVKAGKKRKRVGRGAASGWGKSAGRGHEGAGSRRGYSLNKGFVGGQTPIRQRIPKRGFNNFEFRVEYIPVNLSWIEKNFDAGATIGLQEIAGKGIKLTRGSLIKVLGNGEITKAVNISAHAISKSAQEKIEKAGGTVTILVVPVTNAAENSDQKA